MMRLVLFLSLIKMEISTVVEPNIKNVCLLILLVLLDEGRNQERVRFQYTTSVVTEDYATANIPANRLTITDAGAQNSYKVNSPAGEYGILSCSTAWRS